MKEKIVEWFKQSMNECGGKKAVIGISGGKDSTIIAAIAVEALGKENVLGVLMPNGEQKDISDSYRVCKALDIEHVEVNIQETVRSLYAGLKYLPHPFTDNSMPFFLQDVALNNTPPRIRMTTLYAIAGSIPGGRVINTSNRSESYIGYCTKWGDMCGDLYPFINLTVKEVLELGDEFNNIPADLIHKIPEDGLSGKTDEDNIGFTYAALDKYLLDGICEDGEAKARINKLHAASLHKTGSKTVFKR